MIGISQDTGPEKTWMARRRRASDALIGFAKNLEHPTDFGMPEKISTGKEVQYLYRFKLHQLETT